MIGKIKRNLPAWLMALMAVQSFCAVFFVGDVISDYRMMGTAAAGQTHLYFEAMATVALVAGIVFEGWFLVELLRRQARLEASLATASSAVHEVIEAHFDRWDLTPSEKDVATFLVKGLNTAEIAEVRGRAEGTIKSHLNAIYRKSGTRSRGDLLSVIIDSLMAGEMRGGAAIAEDSAV